MIELKRREELIENNLGLVHACANRFRNRGVEYDDLYQAGCVGLIKAADGYDDSLGYSFSTYAFPVIMGEIKRIFRDGGTVKIGRAMKEKIRNAKQIKDDFTLKNGYEPTVSQMAELMGVDVAEAAEILTASMPIISLTSEDENESRQLDIRVESPDESISEKLALEQTVSSLCEEDKKLIEFRYFKGLTQSKTAQLLGISQVQVSRKEKKILLEMRKRLT
ncbi:MAG: sigma-70 family RNA polymerase sigma factor [Clostridia bacterium]|nr:sigma-70 family RNA polymerase sigma factor [Clostridia bacterium]